MISGCFPSTENASDSWDVAVASADLIRLTDAVTAEIQA
jgi:hypothetical protein